MAGQFCREYWSSMMHHVNYWQEAGGNCVRTGLINTHVHTSQQLARGIADDVDLLTWLHGRIWPYEATMTEDDSYLSTLLCGIELIHSGVCKFPLFIDSSPETLWIDTFGVSFASISSNEYLIGNLFVVRTKVCGCCSVHFHLLQLLPIRFSQWHICCISQSMMKQQKPDWK